MISLEKWKFLTPLQNLSRNVGDLGKLIAAKGFKKLPKVQKIAKSGHTGWQQVCKWIEELVFITLVMTSLDDLCHWAKMTNI